MNKIKPFLKTENIILSFISILILAITLNLFLSSSQLIKTFADESSGSEEASTSSSNDSDEESTEDEDEESTDEVSTPSVDEVSTADIDEVSTPSVDEVSTADIDEVSTPSIDEMSTPDLDEESVMSVKSVKSGMDIDDLEGVGDIIQVGDGAAFVFEDEKLFFIIPVKIEKQLVLDDEGVILEVKQSFLSKLLSWLSF
ncbi:hypothetical protein ACFLZK_00335 [Patescibacteria group bacterium]